MEVKDAPPKTATPARDGSDDLRILILGACRFVDNTQSTEAIEALCHGFNLRGTPLLGCYIARAICHCDRKCPEGSLYGFTLPRTEEAIESIMDFYITLNGLEIKDTTDPDVNRGVFKGYLDVE